MADKFFVYTFINSKVCRLAWTGQTVLFEHANYTDLISVVVVFTQGRDLAGAFSQHGGQFLTFTQSCMISVYVYTAHFNLV